MNIELDNDQNLTGLNGVKEKIMAAVIEDSRWTLDELTPYGINDIGMKLNYRGNDFRVTGTIVIRIEETFK